MRNRVLDPNQRNLILKTGVQNGLKDEWDFAFEQYKATGDTTFLVAMANTKQAELIYMYITNNDIITVYKKNLILKFLIFRMMEMIVDPVSGIYEGNLNTLFSNIAANPLGNSIAMDYLTNHWDEFVR